MPKYTVVPSQITDEMVIDFDSLPHKADYQTNLQPLDSLETSEKLLNFALRQTPYTPFKYKNKKTKQNVIGYNGKLNMLNHNGVLEADAYSEWIEKFKDAEREFKRFFPLDRLTQNQYDALVSLYYFTGRWDRVGTEIASFNLKPDIQAQRWDRVATALIYNGNSRMRSQAEAKIMMLGDYGRHTPRSVLKKNGIKLIQAEYLRLTDSVARQQCEVVFYIETSRFLPGLTQPRMRQIVDYVEQNNITKNQIFNEPLPEVTHLIELDEPEEP